MVANKMNKASLKVSVSHDDSNSESSSEESEHEVEVSDTGSDSTTNVQSDDDVLIKNEGWADSITKILGSNKPKNKKTLVLSRAKKLADTLKTEKEEKPSFEVVGDKPTEIKTEVKKEKPVSSEPPVKKKRVEQSKSTIRVKPDILEKDRERLLTKIATKGVVQLFNAVRNQQKNIENETKDMPEGKKEKVLKKFDKRAFLDSLMGQSKSIVVEDKPKLLKDELKSESEKPRWNALRDDFMMGAKMKDWDKESLDE